LNLDSLFGLFRFKWFKSESGCLHLPPSLVACLYLLPRFHALHVSVRACVCMHAACLHAYKHAYKHACMHTDAYMCILKHTCMHQCDCTHAQTQEASKRCTETHEASIRSLVPTCVMLLVPTCVANRFDNNYS